MTFLNVAAGVFIGVTLSALVLGGIVYRIKFDREPRLWWLAILAAAILVGWSFITLWR